MIAAVAVASFLVRMKPCIHKAGNAMSLYLYLTCHSVVFSSFLVKSLLSEC